MTGVLVTGMTLKLERVGRNVKQTDLAARMGVSRTWLSTIESRYAVDPDVAQRYRQALVTFPSLASPSEPVEAA
jgi:transcriptional regulator with XRE-family HTH domain